VVISTHLDLLADGEHVFDVLDALPLSTDLADGRNSPSLARGGLGRTNTEGPRS
jgi:hypothetical protein